MKVKKTECGVELEPETLHERECLEHLHRQSQVTMKFDDDWDNTGNLTIEGRPHPWDV